MNYTIIKTNGDSQEFKPANGHKPSYEELTKIVGGYIEYAPGVLNGKRVEMVCNEEGLIDNLPINFIASCIRRGLGVGYEDSIIVGDVLLQEKEYKKGKGQKLIDKVIEKGDLPQ